MVETEPMSEKMDGIATFFSLRSREAVNSPSVINSNQNKEEPSVLARSGEILMKKVRMNENEKSHRSTGMLNSGLNGNNLAQKSQNGTKDGFLEKISEQEKFWQETPQALATYKGNSREIYKTQESSKNAKDSYQSSHMSSIGQSNLNSMSQSQMSFTRQSQVNVSNYSSSFLQPPPPNNFNNQAQVPSNGLTIQTHTYSNPAICLPGHFTTPDALQDSRKTQKPISLNDLDYLDARKGLKCLKPKKQKKHKDHSDEMVLMTAAMAMIYKKREEEMSSEFYSLLASQNKSMSLMVDILKAENGFESHPSYYSPRLKPKKDFNDQKIDSIEKVIESSDNKLKRDKKLASSNAYLDEQKRQEYKKRAQESQKEKTYASEKERKLDEAHMTQIKKLLEAENDAVPVSIKAKSPSIQSEKSNNSRRAPLPHTKFSPSSAVLKTEDQETVQKSPGLSIFGQISAKNSHLSSMKSPESSSKKGGISSKTYGRTSLDFVIEEANEGSAQENSHSRSHVSLISPNAQRESTQRGEMPLNQRGNVPARQREEPSTSQSKRGEGSMSQRGVLDETNRSSMSQRSDLMGNDPLLRSTVKSGISKGSKVE